MATKTSRRKAPHKQSNDIIAQEFQRSKALRIFGLIGAVVLIAWIVVAILEPTPAYRLSGAVDAPVTSTHFIHELEGLTGAVAAANTHVEPFYNGESYYEAELAAMKSAEHSIDLVAYIFKSGEIANRAIAIMAERARAGVHVNMLVDSLGSVSSRHGVFRPLTDAGGTVRRYNPLRWNNWFRYNNRTHRELLIVDGRVAFLGGAGYADYWFKSVKKEPRWRDSMFRVSGDAVNGLQSAFVENWVEASDQVIVGPDYFPELPREAGHPALVVASSPSMGGSTEARLLFTALVAAAHQSIDICTPYFIPDKGLRNEMVKAERERDVQIRILVPGDHTDHKVVRASSRSTMGDLLASGARVYEYSPAMIHQKLLIVDHAWVVVGSTNFDTRSFGLNDEVNLAILDQDFATRVTEQYDRDLRESKPITYAAWQHRSIWERGEALVGFLWSRQQ